MTRGPLGRGSIGPTAVLRGWGQNCARWVHWCALRTTLTQNLPGIFFLDPKTLRDPSRTRRLPLIGRPPATCAEDPGPDSEQAFSDSEAAHGEQSRSRRRKIPARRKAAQRSNLMAPKRGGETGQLPETNFRPATGLSKRRLELIELLVHEGLGTRDAAKRLGMSIRNVNYALSEPNFLAEYNRQKRALREGLRPKALHKLDALMEGSTSQKVQLDAAKTLMAEEGENQRNTNVNVGISVTPGYVMVMSSERLDKVREILTRSGSTRSLLDGGKVVDG